MRAHDTRLRGKGKRLLPFSSINDIGRYPLRQLGTRLLISGSKVRALVRPPSKHLKWLAFFSCVIVLRRVIRVGLQAGLQTLSPVRASAQR